MATSRHVFVLCVFVFLAVSSTSDAALKPSETETDDCTPLGGSCYSWTSGLVCPGWIPEDITCGNPAQYCCMT
ncbi:hypothetical protein BaRGS_00022585 [Batillaria attramentaria]|uniref:Uncharacterized protein n=1 Tax=Batillaria attramentaria TaxID=370345 RepID=A0ABD0KGE3_9CAEN